MDIAGNRAFLSFHCVADSWTCGALVAYSIAAAIALRKQLKRSFLPVLALGVIGFVGLASGLFDYGITRYAERATVESGRFLVWPLVVKRIIASPIVGVPTDDIATEVPNLSDPVSPHSGLLFVALCGGVVALGFFLVHWARCFQASIRPSSPIRWMRHTFCRS